LPYHASCRDTGLYRDIGRADGGVAVLRHGRRVVNGASNPAAPPPASRVGEVRQAAESLECRNNLSQIRAAIQMRTTTDETYPASLNELGLPASMLVCPVSGQPYQYDPTTGQVRCTTPGHMRY
jgi:hypothetical protein